MRAYEPEDGRVERLRGVGGEDDAVGMAAAQKVGHGHAARERGARRGQVALSRTAARTPECRHRGGHRIDYARRPHERCRRAIEIYHRIHLPFAPTIPSLQGPERIVPRAAPHEPEALNVPSARAQDCPSTDDARSPRGRWDTCITGIRRPSGRGKLGNGVQVRHASHGELLLDAKEVQARAAGEDLATAFLELADVLERDRALAGEAGAPLKKTILAGGVSALAKA